MMKQKRMTRAPSVRFWLRNDSGLATGPVRCLLVVTCLLALAGCTNVYSSRPIGEQAAVLDEEAWEGTWVNRGGAMTIMVEDAGQGALQAAWVEENDGVLKLHSFHVMLRQSGDWIFCNLREPDEQDEQENTEERYLWGRIKNQDGQILFWLPEVDKVKALVEQGVLPGTVDEEGDVLLSPLTPEQLQVITSGEHGVLLDWEEPIVLLRLPSS
jgi:hypothetical protein